MTTQEELNQINNKIIKKYEELVAVQDRLIDNLEKQLAITSGALDGLATLALAHDDIAIADEVVGVFETIGRNDLADKIREQINQKEEK